MSENFLRIILLFAVSTWATASYVGISKHMGRLSTVPTYDDCRYMYAAMLLKYDLQHGGVGAVIRTAREQGLHSPIAYFQALLAYQFLGMEDVVVYRTNLLVMIVYVAVLAWLMRSVSILAWLAATTIFVTLPIAKMAVVEFRPDIFWGIWVCFGAFLTMIGEKWTRRTALLSGLAFSMAFLTKPAVFPLTVVILLVAIAARLFYTRLFEKDSRKFQHLIWLLVPIFVLAGWYYVIFGGYIWNYFYTNSFGAQADVWAVKANFLQHFLYYINGNSGISNMGRLGVLVAACTILLIIWRCWTGNWEVRVRTFSLVGLGCLIYLINSVSEMKQEFVGSGFYLTIIFLCAWLLGQFYNTYRDVRPARGVVTCGLIILAFVAIKYLNDWPPYSYLSEGQRNLYKEPTQALISELRNMEPRPASLLFMQPLPIPPEDIGMWLLRNSIRPKLLNGFGHSKLDQFWNEKRRADVVVVPTPKTPGIMTPLHVTSLLPSVIQDLKRDPDFFLLRVIPSGSGEVRSDGGIYVFVRKQVL